LLHRHYDVTNALKIFFFSQTTENIVADKCNIWYQSWKLW